MLFAEFSLNLNMSTTELKRLLISKIDDTNDEPLLQAIYTLLNTAATQEPYTLNEQQEQSVYASKKDIAAGDYILNKDLHDEVLKWLNE